METAFDEMVAAVQNSSYRKYEIKDPCIYLQNLIEGGVIMEQFITKKELADLLDKCIRLGVYMQEGPAAGKAPDELAQMMFDGGLSLDIAALKHELADKEAKLERERLLDERRGGLSHEELSGKIMEGIVNGALNIHHGEAAPYSGRSVHSPPGCRRDCGPGRGTGPGQSRRRWPRTPGCPGRQCQ